MKKHLFYASLFLAALSSCSKDDDRVSAPAGEVNNDLEEIKLAVTGAEAFNVQTRGTGMVGGLTDAENLWNGQELYILMTDSGKVTPVKPNYTFQATNVVPEFILNNVKVNAPVENGSAGNREITGNGDLPFYYYPTMGNFDFYGYHIDDAVIVADTSTVQGENNKTIVVNIDGSQDLMVAKANWDTDYDKAEDLTPSFNGLSWSDNAKYKYGAYAARRGVQPTLKFEHLLAQLQFSVENESKDYDISVKEISVFSNDTAKITIAGDDFSSIVWQDNKEAAPTALKVKVQKDGQNQLVDLDSVKLEKNSPETKIGNLLVAASGKTAQELVTEYKGQIVLSQVLKATVANGTNVDSVTISQTVPFTIALPQQTSVHPNFLAGHAYQVKIYVYGLNLIKVTADLTAWENGGGFEVTPEDQVNTKEDAIFTPTDDDLEDALERESIKLYNTLSSDKLFSEKCDTLLAYLGIGYSVAQVTRGAEFVYNPATYGEIDFAPYADPQGNVSVATTYKAKKTWAATDLIKAAWLVKDEATHNMLPESYLADYPYTDEFTAPTLPWLAVVFENPIYASTLVITVEGPNGFEKEISYPTVNKEVSLLTLDDDELGTEIVPGTWKVTVNNSVYEIVVPAATTETPAE